MNNNRKDNNNEIKFRFDSFGQKEIYVDSFPNSNNRKEEEEKKKQINLKL